MIAIIAALDEEIESIIKKMENPAIQTACGITYYKGSYLGRSVAAARCGIGKVFASLAAAALILECGADLIVNVGVAGSLKNDIFPGDVVISTDCVQHDYRLTKFEHERGEVAGINISNFPSINVKTDFSYQNFDFNVKFGKIATGDSFICDEKVRQDISESFGALACDMESGAIAQVSYVNNIKFLAIRAISDEAESGAEVSFEENVNSASQNAIKIFDTLLKNGDLDV